MRRLSFRLTLLLGFLLVSLLLGAAALRGLLMLEEFAGQSRAGSALAVQMTADIQQLAERSVDLERSARQYLVLQHPDLKLRFETILGEARQLLDRIQSAEVQPIDIAANGWRDAAYDANIALAQNDGEAALTALARMGEQNGLLAEAGRHWIDGHNARLLEELERNRLLLLMQVVAAVAAALAIGAGIGWWVVRPVSALEAAIERLGASQFDRRIEIRGPADLQRLGERLDWLRRRLAELESDRVRVLRHVSHELKTPLAALREGVALLKDEVVGTLTTNQQLVVGILDQNTRALQRQIEDLLNYHAAVFDAAHLERRRVQVDELLQSVVDEQRLQLQARGLQVEISGGPVQATLDPDKLRVALGNLVSNAITFSPEGSTLQLATSVAGGHLLIDCIDAGPGVAQEDVARIFEPFYQGSRQPAVPRQGSGVGLSIVRELVAAQGGRVSLQPSACGAHFRVELPHE